MQFAALTSELQNSQPVQTAVHDILKPRHWPLLLLLRLYPIDYGHSFLLQDIQTLCTCSVHVSNAHVKKVGQYCATILPLQSIHCTIQSKVERSFQWHI